MKKKILLFALVCISISLSAQIHWTKNEGNPVMVPDQDWETRLIAPNAVIFDNDQYHMWYTGGEFPVLGSDLFIGHAISSDGISWTKDEGNPVFTNDDGGSWESKGVYKPSVLKIGSTYHMWYNGYSDTLNATPRNIGHATSIDGIIWERDSENPVLVAGAGHEWDYSRMANPTVVHDGTMFHMWYAGFNGNGSDIHLGHATSDDGTTWTKDPDNPVITYNSNNWEYPQLDYPIAVFDGDTFHIWYNAGGFLAWNMAYATSSDGTTWTKHEEPVLRPGSSGDWDSRYISMPVVLYDSVAQMYKMWYRGESLANTRGGIGYAEAGKDSIPTIITENFKNTMLIYPNPASDHLLLKMEESGEYVLRIISLSGQIIFNETVYGSLKHIDLSRLQSGLYQIIVSTNNSVLSEKFVKR